MNLTPHIANIKKEFWEYKGILTILPILVVAVTVLFPAINLMLGNIVHHNLEMGLKNLEAMQHTEQIGLFVVGMLGVIFMPFAITAFFVQLYYFVACLFDEKRDLSAVFWRSLPVSDTHSVLYKLVFGAFVIPAVFFLVATGVVIIGLILATIGMGVISSSYDISLWGILWSGDWISNILIVWLNIIPFALWMLPLFAWLMLASIFANKAPFLWAILPVALVLMVEAFITSYLHLPEPFFGSMLSDYFNFTHTDNVNIRIELGKGSKMAIWSALADKVSVIALILSGAMLYAAMWLRKNRN